MGTSFQLIMYTPDAYLPLCNAALTLPIIFAYAADDASDLRDHGLRTPREEIAFTAKPKIKSQFQIFRYGRNIFCLPHWYKISDLFDLCLHWVSVVRVRDDAMHHFRENTATIWPTISCHYAYMAICNYICNIARGFPRHK